MKQIFTGLIVLIFSLNFFSTPVSAHILKTDGTIGAVLHIDPDDNPIVGQIAYFFFEFKDTTGKFDPAKCDCSTIILENGQAIFSNSLNSSGTTSSLASASFSFTFPKKDVYTLEVTGKPTSGANFQTFKLDYDIRVDRGNNNPTFALPFNFERYVAIGAILFAFIFFFILGTIRERKLKGGK